MQEKRQRRISIPILAALALLVVGVTGVFKEQLAAFVWGTFRAETIAYALTSDDSALAMQVGLYHFSHAAYDLDRARAAFTHALSIDPRTPWAHYQLARIAFIEGDMQTAVAEAEKELSLYPEHVRTHYVLGLVYGYRGFPGDMERAERAFERFVEKNPDEWAGYNDLAWTQVTQGEYAEARATVRAAFEQLPRERDRNLWLWTTLGSAELNLSNNAEALAAFTKAQQIADSVTAQYFWGAYPGNDPRNADEAFRQYQASLQYNFALAYERLERWGKAREAYAQYLALAPDDPARSAVEQKVEALQKKIEE